MIFFSFMFLSFVILLMADIPFEIASAVVTALCTVIGIIWKAYHDANKKLSDNESTKVTLLKEETDKTKNMAIEAIKLGAFREDVIEKFKELKDNSVSTNQSIKEIKESRSLLVDKMLSMEAMMKEILKLYNKSKS